MRTDLREKRRNIILISARACFKKNGYDKTKMSDVAKAAGLSKGVVYNYFSDKENLFGEVIKTDSAEQIKYLEDHLPNNAVKGSWSFKDELDNMLEEIFSSSSVENLLQADCLVQAWHSNIIKSILESTLEEYKNALKNFLEAGIRNREIDGNAEALALTIIAVADGLVLQNLLSPDVSNKQMIMQIKTIISDGIFGRTHRIEERKQ